MQSKNNECTILLSAGKINYTNLPISTNTSNSMIPINGKPVIAWILEDLINKGINEVVIVLRAEDILLKEFLNRAFRNKISLRIFELEYSCSILHSLKEGMRECGLTGLIRIILGDTLIQDSFESKDDFLYVQDVEDSSRWCLAVTAPDGYIKSYVEKQPLVSKLNKALCGYYHLQDCSFFKDCVDNALQVGHTQISDSLLLYQKKYPIQARWAKKWYDFGNIDNLIKGKQQLLQSRYFNSLSIDPILNTITKVSEYDEKLRNELHWYESLPEKLKVLTPRIISREEKNKKLHLVQEYYGYPTLAELFLYSDLNIENWKSILEKLLAVHQLFTEDKRSLSPDNFYQIYVTKTLNRIDMLIEQENYWKDLFEKEIIVVNGNSFENISVQKEKLVKIAEGISYSSRATIMHGDFCFSNILYDVNNQIVRLIDPRGSFGEVGIYGDPRYDIAKLRHSVCGLYDYIVSDLFEIIDDNNNFVFQVYSNNLTEQISDIFDQLISEIGYDPLEIKMIEALLFLSMLPLHKDKPKRQKAMFITGLLRYHEVVKAT